MLRLKSTLSAAAAVLALTLAAAPAATAQTSAPAAIEAPTPRPLTYDVSTAGLLQELPGFESRFAEVNGVRLHYVVGGEGPLLVLLPGWPETWWSYHKVMPDLARHYRVVSVDLRGMGESEAPEGGYDKKTMARDILELVRSLGGTEANIVGHDIGAQVAWSYAANFPDATTKLVMLDVPHPDQGLYSWPIIPGVGTFGDKIDPAAPFAWWFAFHQVNGLPEDLLEGRVHIEHEWFFRYLLVDEGAIDARDRAVYAAAYNSRERIRSGNAWYKAFPQDIVDEKTYAPLQMPVLGLAGPGYGWLNATLTAKASNSTVEQVEGSGHFLAEEKPEIVTSRILAFLGE